MKRIALTITTAFLMIAPASAGAETYQTFVGQRDPLNAMLTHPVNADRTDYYYDEGDWGVLRMTLYKSKPRNINHDDTFQPIEFEPSLIDTRNPVEKETKPGCKKKTNYGRLKFRLKNIDCEDATDIFDPEYCKHGKSRWEFTCRDGRAAIKTEWAYELVPVKAWRYCGNQIYIKQYALFSVTGKCDLTGVIEGIQAHIIQGMMPWGMSANRYGFREGNRLAVMETSAIWDYAVPADGKESWKAAWWSFPNLPVLEIY